MRGGGFLSHKGICSVRTVFLFINTKKIYMPINWYRQKSIDIDKKGHAKQLAQHFSTEYQPVLVSKKPVARKYFCQMFGAVQKYCMKMFEFIKSISFIKIRVAHTINGFVCPIKRNTLRSGDFKKNRGREFLMLQNRDQKKIKEKTGNSRSRNGTRQKTRKKITVLRCQNFFSNISCYLRAMSTRGNTRHRDTSSISICLNCTDIRLSNSTLHKCLWPKNPSMVSYS